MPSKTYEVVFTVPTKCYVSAENIEEALKRAKEVLAEYEVCPNRVTGAAVATPYLLGVRETTDEG